MDRILRRVVDGEQVLSVTVESATGSARIRALNDGSITLVSPVSGPRPERVDGLESSGAAS